MKYKLTRIVCTCSACPTQYEGRFEDGDDLYIRYRYGELTVYKTPHGREHYSEGHLLLEVEHGADLDGTLEDAELIQHCKDLLTFPDEFVQRAQSNPTARGDALVEGILRFAADSKEWEESGTDVPFFTWRHQKRLESKEGDE